MIMRANPPAGTGPELRLRSALHRAGLRFWKNHLVSVEDVRTQPDVVFPRARVAVFVDGCFWHSCPEHGTRPRANAHYWAPKLARTVKRDRRADRALSAAGWLVIRVWEHDPIAQAVARVTTAVRASGVQPRQTAQSSMSPRRSQTTRGGRLTPTRISSIPS